MITAKMVAQQLAQRTEEIARYLLPNGKKNGAEWCVGSINGEAGQSLKVHLTGEKAGVWSDFATGEKGDLLELWRVTRHLNLQEAIKESTHYLGISLPQFTGYKPATFVKPVLNNNSKLPLSSPIMRYLIDERKLTVETIEAYKIRGNDREIIFPYWRNDDLIFIKYLNLDRIGIKKKMYTEKKCEPCLFGWHLIPDNVRTIAITEGEIDTMSLYQYGIPALSVPFGGGGGDKQSWLEHEFDRLSVFDEIYLCLDDDKDGWAATVELVERLGRHRCRIVKLPFKDANECLQSGVLQETITQCFDKALTLDPEELKSANQFVDQVIDEFYPPPGIHTGYEAPWEKAKGILFRPAELSIWTGINGHGKSQFLGQIILHSMKQRARVCIASLELKPSRLLMRLTRQAGAIEHPSIEYIQAIHQWYEDKLWLFDLLGTAKAKRLLEVFLYARQRYGIDVFVIDSFMKLDIAEDDYKSQKAFIEQLCDFKNQHNCHIHVVVHPRKSIDESQPPGKLDNKGTGAITDLADNCFTVWRNKLKEHLQQSQSNGIILNAQELKTIDQSDCIWSCDKQRNGDWEGKMGFSFHRPTLQYLNTPGQKPIRLVDYSNCTNSV